MGGDIPKPLIRLDGKPVIEHLLTSITGSGICDELAIVVGNQATLLKETLGPDLTYVTQREQLGTGHAVKVCRSTLEGKADSVIVLYADHPFIDTKTITALASLRASAGTVMSMATITVPDFNDWRKPLYSYGRVLRDELGQLAAIVEKKDTTEEQLAIKEVSPSFFCFDADWLWKNLEAVKNDNAQGEYYLTDLVKLAFEQHKTIACMDADPKAAIGINTPEELELAEKLVSESID